MADEPVVADSTPAEVDPFEGRNPTLDEFQRYRRGELPVANDTPEETVEPAGDEPETEPESEPDEAQEPPQKGSGAEKRIKQLLAEKKELQRKLEAKQDAKPESSPAPEVQQTTRSKPTADDKKADGTPKFNTYEDFVEELADWKAEQRLETAKREQAQQDAQKALRTKLDAARERYADADDVIFPANEAIQSARIPLAVKEVFAQSDLFVDLCYVVGSDPEELRKFISLAQTNPRAAIGKVFEYERGIQEELSKPRDDKGQFIEKVPEVKKTSAPKPPSPVGGAASRAFDVSDESLSSDEWMRKRNQQLSQKRG